MIALQANQQAQQHGNSQLLEEVDGRFHVCACSLTWLGIGDRSSMASRAVQILNPEPWTLDVITVATGRFGVVPRVPLASTTKGWPPTQSWHTAAPAMSVCRNCKMLL